MRRPSLPAFILFLVWAFIGGPALSQDQVADGGRHAKEERGADGEGAKVGPTLGERMDEIMAAYYAANHEHLKAIRLARTEEERKRIPPGPRSYVPAREVMKLAAAEPGDPASADAVFRAARLGGAPVFAEVEALVKEHFMDTEGLEDYCMSLLHLPAAANPTGLLEHIRAESGRMEARAAATYVLGQLIWRSRDREAALGFYAEAAEKYPEAMVDGRSLAEMARHEIFLIDRLQEGKPAPEIEGSKVRGPGFKFSKFKLSDYRGRVVVLEFFGHWVPICRGMYHHHWALTEELKDAPFSLIGINSDPRPVLETITGDGTVTWECVWDGGGTKGPIATRWGVQGWPTSYILDHEGVIRFKSLRGEEMTRAVKTLLAEVPDKAAKGEGE